MFDISILFRLEGDQLILLDAGRFLLILIAGAFGGLLYSIQNRTLNLPNFSAKEIDLGVIADCLIGIGGSLVVFLIVPGGAKELQLLELSATAIIGGYGGRSLLDQALDSMLRQQVQENTQKIKADKERAKRDADTLQFLSLYLDKSLELSTSYEEELLNNIQYISLTTRRWVFDKTQLEFYKLRQKNVTSESRTIEEEKVEKKLVDNTRKIFEKLRDSDEERTNDRYPAHAAYAYMELGKWKKAIPQLEEAKKRLNSSNNKGGDKKNELVYEINLAICKCYLAATVQDRQKIIDDLFKNFQISNNNIKMSVPQKYANQLLSWKSTDKISIEQLS